MARQQKSRSPFAGIVIFAFIAFMLYIIVTMVTGVVSILYSYLALPLLLIALFLNYNVVTDYIGWIWKTIKEDTGKGLLYAAGSIVGYPFVAAWLAMKAYLKRSVGSKRTKEGKKKGEYIKYEEVQDESEDFLDLEDLDKHQVKEKQSRSGNEYDDMFS